MNVTETPQDQEPASVVTASIWRRFLAYFIDLTLLSVFFTVIGITFRFTERLPDESIITGYNVNVFVLLGFMFYFVVAHKLFGSTLGKFVTRIKVTDSAGARPGLSRLIGRDILSIRYIPWWYKVTPEGFISYGSTLITSHQAITVTVVIIAYFFFQNGFLLFNKERRTLADTLAGTKLIRR